MDRYITAPQASMNSSGVKREGAYEWLTCEEVATMLNEREALQARVRELEALAGEAVEVAQFYGNQCEEWYQKKYDYDADISELKERLSKLKGTP